jgi:hypothetical protein
MNGIRKDIKRVFENIHNITNPDQLDGLLARYKLLLKKYNEEENKKIVAKIKKS